MKIKYPVYFEGNTCIHCGSNGSLIYIDRMGNETKQPIYPICKIKCSNCNTEYFVRWIRNNKDKLVPVCISKDEITEFENGIVKFAMETKKQPK